MKIIKKFVAVALVFMLVLAVMPVSALADDTITVTINGDAVDFEDQAPIMVSGRVLVPVRFVFMDLGFEVDWNRSTRTATLERDDYTIVIIIGQTTFTVNGTSHELDVPAELIGGRTMVPLGPILRAVGYSLEWDRGTRVVSIDTPQLQPPEPPAPVDNIIPNIEVELVVIEYGRAIEGVTMVLTDVYDRVAEGKLWQGFYFAPTGTVTFSRDIPILVTESAPDRPYGYTYKYVYYRTFYAGVAYPISEFQYEAEWGLTWHSILVFDLNILDAEAANQRLYESNPNVGPFITFVEFRVPTEQSLGWLYDDDWYVALTDFVEWRVPVSFSISLVFEQRPLIEWGAGFEYTEESIRQQDLQREMLDGLVFALYYGDERIEEANPGFRFSTGGVSFASTEDMVGEISIRIIENPLDLQIEIVERLDFLAFDTSREWMDAVDAQRYNPDNLSDRTVFDASDFYNTPGSRFFDLLIFFAKG